MKQVYLRFLALANTLTGTTKQLSDMDETAKRLLETIALRHLQGRPMTVSEAMNTASLASPATIHRKLNDLRDAGLIGQVFEGKNRRTKYLVPTQAADAYFDKLGEVLDEALKTT